MSAWISVAKSAMSSGFPTCAIDDARSAFPDRINTSHALPDKHLNLPQLRDNLFRFVSLVRHL
jgi:hypothetical protein